MTMFRDHHAIEPHILQPAFTGRLVLRLHQPVSTQIEEWVRARSPELPIDGLGKVADLLGLTELSGVLADYGDDAQPLFPPTDHHLVQDLEDRAASLGILAPLRSLLSYFVLLPTRPGHAPLAIESFLGRFRSLPEVDWAIREPALREPSAVAFAGVVTDDFKHKEQGYLDGDGIGIHTRSPKVWGLYDGTGVGFADIERGWSLDHVDLKQDDGTTRTVTSGMNVIDEDPGPLPTNDRLIRAKGIQHGTQTLGVVLGRDHPSVPVDEDGDGVYESEILGTGIVGIAPRAKGRLFSRVVTWAEQWDLTGAIVKATADLSFGDVLLLEVETVDPSKAKTSPASGLYPQNALPGHPVELADHWFDAIRLAVGNGIVVVEPAGNAGKNLDDVRSDWTGPFESGAIMVSACNAAKTTAGTHKHYSPSDGPPAVNYGVRVDCYAWGEDVCTADYTVGGVADEYGTFGYTSAASAIIAGCAILVQQMNITANGAPLDPQRMRAILSNPSHGTKVETPGGYVRVMPDLAKIADALSAWPDIYVRDRVDDAGYVPNPLVYASPDIIVRQNPANIALELGPASPTATSTPFMDPVIPGQDNYVYVRISNRGLLPADHVSVHVYWSEASAMVPPSVWHPVGSVPEASGLVVPAGNVLTVAGPIIWHPLPNDVPSTGHGCFVALVGATGQDDVPPLLPADSPTWSRFLSYVGASNNIAWRNFNVGGFLPGPEALMAAADFVILGAPGGAEAFDLLLEIEAHPEAQVRWLLPQALLDAIARGRWCLHPARSALEFAGIPGEGRGEFRWRGLEALLLQGIRLPERPQRCRLELMTPGDEVTPVRVVVRQLIDGKEVGRLTRVWVSEKDLSKAR